MSNRLKDIALEMAEHADRKGCAFVTQGDGLPTSQESATAIIDAAKRGDFEGAAVRALLVIQCARPGSSQD